ncbi:MAG: ion transporter [Gammaproteobacteria bacterium]|jgi:voltage-gated sodium channel|nr:ion transporter [Gammaproteobacteria bacterium]
MSNAIQRLQNQLFELHSNKLFEFTVIFIIVFSALITGAKTYEVSSTTDALIQGLDWFITLFFLFEVTIKLISEPRTLDFFKKGWNVFDFVIVVASLIPIDGNETVLLARLLRIFRVLRLVSVIPELRILINSLLKALPRMGYIALLMFIIFYIYAAIGSFMFENINPILWSNISIAMLTLFRVSTLEDWTDVMYETMEVYPLSWIFYLTFIFLTAFVFLNMMIGVVLDVMQREQNQYEQERDDTEAEEVLSIKAEISEVNAKLDRLHAVLEQQPIQRTQKP